MSSNFPSMGPMITNEKVSILLVDDNKVNQFLGKQILRNIGFTNVKVASDGHVALKMITEQNFDILLTDVEMPGMNGYELTTAVRQLDSIKNSITIIALTANASSEEYEHALQFGMNDYLSKPYSPEDLQSVLQKHIKLKNVFFISEYGTAITQEVTGNTPVTPIYKMFNGNKDDVKVLLLMIKMQIPESMDALKSGILCSNWPEAFSAAHKLKSTVKLFMIDSLFNKASGIAELARNQSEVHNIPGLYDELHTELQGVLVMINKELEELT